MSLFRLLLCLPVILVPLAKAADRAVFAHYMVGTTTSDHINQDVDDAIAMGLDGFALNVQCPTDAFAGSLIQAMSHYIVNQGYFFRIFISMDVYASGSATCGKSAADYVDLCVTAMGLGAYYMVGDKYLVSTYSSGGGTWKTWASFKTSVGNEGFPVYWIPDLGDTDGYWESDSGWWYYWGNLTEGLFSWESAWPGLGQDASDQIGGAGGVTRDQVIIDAAETEDVSYMIPLSLMQYKNSYATNVYRQGEHNFMQRLNYILEVESDTLQFVEYITWNDSPEGHYIGNVWPEQNTDVAPNNYANTDIWPHTALQPIIHSFATAFKASDSPSAMRPQNSQDAVGAIWYHTLAFDDTCPFEGIGEYTFWDKPAGYGTFSLTTHWAVVLDETIGGYDPSDLELIITTDTDDQVVVSNLSAGLNFAQGPNINGGIRVTMVLAPKSGDTELYTASGGKCPASSCTEGFYNLNYQILPLVPGEVTNSCTHEETVLRYTPLNTTANATIDCAQLLTLTDTAAGIWHTSQAGLALEFETTRHALSTTYVLTSTLPSIDSHFNAFDSVGVTDCSDINDDSSCQLPDTCPSVNDYVPYFFAQRSFSIFQRCLREMSTSVFEDGFITALSIDDLVAEVSDYLTPKSDEAQIVKIMGALAAGFTILSGGLGPISSFSSSFAALMGGVFSMISVLDTPSDPADSSAFLADPGSALTDRLSAVIQQYNASLVDLAETVFTTGDLSSFPNYVLDASEDQYGDYYTTDVAKFFAGGRFADANMACGNLATELKNSIQQLLVGYMLVSSNVYIIQNGHSVDDCASSRGTVLDLDSAGSVCYTLEKPGGDAYYADLSDPLSADFFDILYNKYNINLPALVDSSLQCQIKKGYNGTYTPSSSIIPGSGYSTSNLPPCFFNLPVLYTDYTVKTELITTTSGTPCQIYKGTEADGVGLYLPSNLAEIFTAKFCIYVPSH